MWPPFVAISVTLALLFSLASSSFFKQEGKPPLIKLPLGMSPVEPSSDSWSEGDWQDNSWFYPPPHADITRGGVQPPHEGSSTYDTVMGGNLGVAGLYFCEVEVCAITL